MIQADESSRKLVIPAIEKILEKYWDKFVSGQMENTDIEDVKQILAHDTQDCCLSEKMSKFLGDTSYEREDLPSEMKMFLADAMMEEFPHKNHDLSDWVMLLSHWDILDIFCTNIKKRLGTKEAEKYIQSIRETVIQAFDHPEYLLIGDEEKEFLSSVEQWKKETDIQEFWNWGTREWYPFKREFFLILELLLPRYPETFLEIATHLKHPMLLNELIAGACLKGGTKDVLRLLQVAPLSQKNDSDMQWNQSWIAPVLLDEVYQMVVNNYPSNRGIDESQQNAIEEIFSETGVILSERHDGLFLAWNYVKCLLSRASINRNILRLFLSGLAPKLYKKAKEKFSSPISFQTLFSKDINVIRKEFQETGIMYKEDKSICMELMTWIQFFFDQDEYVTEGLFYLETALMFEDDKIGCYEAKIRQCHCDVASMYLAKFSQDVTRGWEATWKLFVMAAYRSRFDYYEEKSIISRKVLNFILLVALVLLEQIYITKDWAKMETFWQILWSIMEERLQYKFSKDDEFTKSYVQILFMYKARLLQEQHKHSGSGNESYTSIIKNEIASILETYPEVCTRICGSLRNL